MLRNLDYCIYTYLHRKELVYRINRSSLSAKDKEALLDRAEVHDIDKLVMYPVMTVEEVTAIHTKHARHHMENALEKTRIDRLEAIFDYESAALKPDKSKNAYDLIRLHKPHLLPEMLPLLEELGMTTSYLNKPDAELEAYISQYLPVTEQMILDEIFEYFQNMCK